jgi:hypothetical protein
MSEPTPAQKRAWLKANRPNVAVGDRGKLSKQAEAEYAAGQVPEQPQR